MATAEQQKIATRKLTHWIENEKKIVTYRDVSREIGCHVNVAKNLLLVHLSAHPSLSPTYLLTGHLLLHSTLTETVIPPPSTAPINPTATQSLRGLAGAGMVRIVDMDQTSDGGNSEHDEDDELAQEEVGNDKGFMGEDTGPGSGLDGNSIKGGEGEDVPEKEEVNRWGVVLVGQEGLEEKKKLFREDSLNIHVYALAPSPVNDPAQYLIPNLALHQHPKYHDPATYGTITGEGFKTKTAPMGTEKKAMKDGGMDWGGGKKAEVKKSGKNEEVKQQDSVKKSETKSEVNAKEEARKPETKTATPSASSSKTAAKVGSSQRNKKRVIQSDTEEDEEETTPAGTTSNTPQTKASSSAKGSANKVQAEPTSSMVRREDQAAMEAMMSMDMDVDMEMGLSDDETPASTKKGKKGNDESAVKVKREPGESGRKKRKVKKSETVQNEKGYMVTRDVYVYESYSGESDTEEESQTKTKTKAKTQTSSVASSKPPLQARGSSASIGSGKEDKKPFGGGNSAKPKTSGKPATGQSTLKGFFTKK
ncbi:hypothetical protein IAR55_000732 [Kwoniella newhampshirensis]|uniref:DNA polymerase delta subunit 3 n=1 Tax=Kwoniella newhampshirensis TaxID=1651941 RepID=A0AAW0Z3Q5_9TREE